MNSETIFLIEHILEDNEGGRVKEIENGYEIAVDKPQSWNGVRLAYPLSKDGIYFVEMDISTENDNSLLEIILTNPLGENRITSFVINSNKIQKIQYPFTSLHHSDFISLRMSTFSGFSTGKLSIRNIRVSNLFPVSNSTDLLEKTKMLGPWFHQLDLDGVKTRDVFKTDSPKSNRFDENYSEQDFKDNPLWIWSKFKNYIPDRLDEKKVLDIACNCGFYSFELSKRGANVMGIDNSYQDIVRANFAKNILKIENVEFRICNVDEMNKEFESQFDMILCLGLLYHLWDPECVINNVSKMTNFAIFETIASNDNSSRLILDPNYTQDGYLPTIGWLKGAFHKAGFSKVELVTSPSFGRKVFVCKKN